MATTKGKVAIIGSGLIGRSWAMLFTSRGYNVFLYDIQESQLTSAKEDIGRQFDRLATQGFLKGNLNAKEQLDLINTSTNLAESIKDAIHVQECVPDIIELKKKVFAQLDELATDGMVLSSSSSAMPCSTFTENLKHKAQCIVSHPINPPYFVPLVELVPAPWTDPEVVVRTRALMEEIGQSPVTLKKEVPAFIAPRVQNALIMESLKLVMDGVISVEDLDTVMTKGLGMRYAFIGPFETTHLNAEGVREYVEKYGEMIRDVSIESGPESIPLTNNPALEPVFEQLERMTPIDSLGERRKYRDEGIARLSDLKSKLNSEPNARN